MPDLSVSNDPEGHPLTEQLVSPPVNALLVFADVVDSSKFSAVLGYEDYARRIVEFQELFRRFGCAYFPRPPDKTLGFTKVEARGDEGVVFVVEPSANDTELVYRAVEFLFHLKGILFCLFGDDPDREPAPTQMSLGAGIHFGPVVCVTTIQNERSVIGRIEGYNINRAKRIESASRTGKYSRVFLSKEAAALLEGQPLVLSRMVVPMAGIEEAAEVLEVQSALLSGLRVGDDTPENERLRNRVRTLAQDPAQIDEPWLKSLVISALDCLLRDSPVAQRRQEYHDLQMKIAWNSPVEDDPILLYLRARGFMEEGRYTQQIRYLREILENHPEFVHARKAMIKACWAIAHSEAERAEKVFARDLASEFLERFPQFLSQEERAEYTALIQEAVLPRKRRRRK